MDKSYPLAVNQTHVSLVVISIKPIVLRVYLQIQVFQWVYAKIASFHTVNPAIEVLLPICIFYLVISMKYRVNSQYMWEKMNSNRLRELSIAQPVSITNVQPRTN